MKTVGDAGPGRLNALAGLLAGVLVLAALQMATENFASQPYVGGYIYNYYFLALVDGTLSVPVQIAGMEGFYDSEGRAFLYQGLGPLITRAAAWPILDLTAWDLRAPTIWLFSSIGSSAFYLLALRMLDGHWPEDEGQERRLGLVLWVMIWVLAPSFVLAANGSFFHEPVSFAFATMGVALLCLWHLMQKDYAHGLWFVGICVAGALAVHGRPHVAVGIYGVAVLAALIMLWKHRARAVLPVGVGMLILLAGGLLYLQMNALRFGSMSDTTGTVTGEGAVYGFIYWGWEEADHPRFVSNDTHGRFNAGRILPNLFFYGLAMSGEWATSFYRRLTVDLGHVRIEPPVLGFVFLWMPWCILSLSAFKCPRGSGGFLALSLAAALPGALVMLAYTTITMRYRLELWPVLFVPAVLALAGMLDQTRHDRKAVARLLFSLQVASLAALVVGMLNMVAYMNVLNWDWGYALRSYENCARYVTVHADLGAKKVPGICVIRD